MHVRRRISIALALACVLPFALAAGGESPIPWPHDGPPSGPALEEQVKTALDFHDRDRFEEFIEASEKGEDSEHMTTRQNEIEMGVYTKELLFLRGDALFGHEFRPENGYGTLPDEPLRRVHTGVYGGLDSFSCAGCHSVGGPDGAGSETQSAFLLGDGNHASSANIRNAPMALGLGMVQALAAEMSIELRTRRDNALLQAIQIQAPITIKLTTKGVDFGLITVHPDGQVDTSGLEGIDGDLIVRPFGWKGNVARLRRFVEDAARVHFGVQSHVLALGYKDNPDVEKLGPGPNWWDPDNDGVQRELEEGTLTAAALYLAMLETPVILPPHDPGLRLRFANGEQLFELAGCAHCHRPELLLIDYYWEEHSDTTKGEPITLHLFVDGDQPRGTGRVRLFSDLKRHDMGEKLADPHPDPESNIPRSVFLTRPLWGLAESAPYLHDGRAATIPEAILEHGGEAQGARDAFAALSPEEQADLHIFLLSLTREPRVRVAQ